MRSCKSYFEARQFCKEADRYVEKGDYVSAIELYTSADNYISEQMSTLGRTLSEMLEQAWDIVAFFSPVEVQSNFDYQAPIYGKATTLKKIGDYKSQQGEYKEAKVNYEMSIQTFKRVNGKGGNQFYLYIDYQIAMLNFLIGNYEESLSYFKLALSSNRRSYFNVDRVAKMLSYQAFLIYSFSSDENCYTQALLLCDEVIKIDSKYIDLAYAIQGNIYLKQQDFENSEKCFHESYSNLDLASSREEFIRFNQANHEFLPSENKIGKTYAKVENLIKNQRYQEAKQELSRSTLFVSQCYSDETYQLLRNRFIHIIEIIKQSEEQELQAGDMPTLPAIHYLWVGPPTQDNPMSLPGHDIAGPISLWKEFQKDIYKEKNSIKFWCLKKYYDNYQQIFKTQGVQIEVCAIENLLKEEEKKLGDNATHTLAEDLTEIFQFGKMTMGEVIDFKDRFSLLLLMKRPGYFFDTNVFPKQGFKLNCSRQENFATARSGISGLNDFYLMYSPNNDNEQLQQAYVRRLETPYYRAGIMTFHNLSIPFLNLDNLGVQKESYQSYKQSSVPGFFRLLELDFEKFKEHCMYADINKQVPCSFSKRSISEYSLCWVDKNLTPEIIRSLPITTEYAYVAGFKLPPGGKPRIYFYDKKRDAAVLVDDYFSSIYNEFPRYSRFSGGSFFEIGTPKELNILMTSFKRRNPKPKQLNVLMSSFKRQNPNDHPPMLVNIEGGTLLHHAVMSNDIEKVSWLIEMGARLDLTAIYQIQPSESDIRYEYTPVQLAKFLKLDEIVDLLQKHAKQATVDLKENSISRPATNILRQTGERGGFGGFAKAADAKAQDVKDSSSPKKEASASVHTKSQKA